MNSTLVQHIRSRDNALFKELRKLALNNTAYRSQGRCWSEGEHLLQAAGMRGVQPELLIYSESYWAEVAAQRAQTASKTIVLADSLWAGLSTLETGPRVACVHALPLSQTAQPGQATVVLDRVQDTGNVGSILRSAAAMGFAQVVALAGTAALWSPRLLRAAMGAHWGLRLIEGATPAALQELALPLLMTSSHEGAYLHDLLRKRELPAPCAWVFGNEGQGVCDELQALCAGRVRIAQPGGEESLNVAAAAAICLHASATQALARVD